MRKKIFLQILSANNKNKIDLFRFKVLLEKVSKCRQLKGFEKLVFITVKTIFRKRFKNLNKSIFMCSDYGNANMYML